VVYQACQWLAQADCDAMSFDQGPLKSVKRAAEGGWAGVFTLVFIFGFEIYHESQIEQSFFYFH
jgi:hypothetical protein